MELDVGPFFVRTVRNETLAESSMLEFKIDTLLHNSWISRDRDALVDRQIDFNVASPHSQLRTVRPAALPRPSPPVLLAGLERRQVERR